MRAIVFLDIDGVLNSERSARIFRTCQKLCPEAVANLNRITGECDAGIVVSSTWRLGRSTAQMVEVLRTSGIDGAYMGMTPDLDFRERGYEIDAWLRENKWADPFVILDDDGDMVHLMDRLVKTSSRVGLTAEDVKKAIALLNRTSNSTTDG